MLTLCNQPRCQCTHRFLSKYKCKTQRWTCKTFHGSGYICETYDGRMNMLDQIHVLKSRFNSILNHQNLIGEWFTFQHANDPKCIIKATITYHRGSRKPNASLALSIAWPKPNRAYEETIEVEISFIWSKTRGAYEIWEIIEVEWETFG